MIYSNYGITSKMWYEIDTAGHEVLSGQPVKVVKWLHEQLGYVSSSADWNADGDANALGSVQEFDIAELIPSDWDFEDSGFADVGLIYVPTVCEDESESCKIVFALHGCGGNAQWLSNSWGLNAFASTNKLIIVYPESECWDNHGD